MVHTIPPLLSLRRLSARLPYILSKSRYAVITLTCQLSNSSNLCRISRYSASPPPLFHHALTIGRVADYKAAGFISRKLLQRRYLQFTITPAFLACFFTELYTAGINVAAQYVGPLNLCGFHGPPAAPCQTGFLPPANSHSSAANGRFRPGHVVGDHCRLNGHCAATAWGL